MQEHWSPSALLYCYSAVKKLEGPVASEAAAVVAAAVVLDSTPTEGPKPNPPHAEPPISPDGPGPPIVRDTVEKSDVSSKLTVLQLGNAYTKKRALIKFEGTLAGRPAIGLLDSGASGNFVSSSFIREHGLTTEAVDGDRLRVTLADGSQQDACGMLQGAELVLGTY